MTHINSHDITIALEYLYNAIDLINKTIIDEDDKQLILMYLSTCKMYIESIQR